MTRSALVFPTWKRAHAQGRQEAARAPAEAVLKRTGIAVSSARIA